MVYNVNYYCTHTRHINDNVDNNRTYTTGSIFERTQGKKSKNVRGKKLGSMNNNLFYEICLFYFHFKHYVGTPSFSATQTTNNWLAYVLKLNICIQSVDST